MKALLTELNTPYELTHDLGRLQKTLEAAGERLPSTPLRLSALNFFVVVYRYDLLFQFESPNRADLIETVRILREHVLIWSDPVNVCTSVGLFLLLWLPLPFCENRASSSRGRFERRLISLIFAGRNRIILIRRELPLTNGASQAGPVA